MLSFRAQMAAALLALGMFLLCLDLVRRRKLKEEYSLLWIGVTAAMTIIAFWKGLLFWIAAQLGILNANTVIFLSGLGFLIMVAVHYSIRLSELTDRNKDLAQSVAILSSEIEELRKKPRS
ncbi:MAG TPA: DUF2304 domain-containing protein [Candidatus Eisenbacteria bacterium]